MANQIWVTGDIHSRIERFTTESFPEQKEMDKTDVVEVLGDFGLVWEREESKVEKYWLDWLQEKPFTTIATLGNHENYDRIEKLPVEERFGAPVWVLRPDVLLLQSGYVYTINGKKIWNFNGARSHDTRNGILDSDDPNWKKQAKALERSGRTLYRVKGVSWWKQEIEQNPEVYERGIAELEKNDWRVNYIFTHCTSQGNASMLGFYEQDDLTKYFEYIHSRVSFDAWYFGHYHENKTVLPHEYCLYEQIERIV